MTMAAADPRGVSSFQDFLDRHPQVVRELSGADKTDWNGRFGSTRDTDNEIVHGHAAADGTLEYHDKRVWEVLKDAFEHAGEPRSQEDRIRIWNALAVTLHENSHLLSRAGTSRLEAQRTKNIPGVQPFEEGVSEAWTHTQVRRYIEALGFERIVPGISEERGRYGYREFAPGAHALAERISELSRENGQPGMSTTEVLRQLNNVNKAEKWHLAADLVLQSNGLADRIPEGPERDEARRRVADEMRKEFAKTNDLDPTARSTLNDSRVIGQQAFDKGLNEVRVLEWQYQEGERGRGFEWDPGTEQEWDEWDDWGDRLRTPVEDLSVGDRLVEPSRYVAAEAASATSVEDLQDQLDADAELAAAEANPDRVYATDTLTTDRGLAQEEWDRQQADPNRQNVAEVQEEPESVRAERLAAERASAEQIDSDLDASVDSDFDEPGLANEGFDGQGADTVDRDVFDPAAANQWAPPAATDRLDRPAIDQQQDARQQHAQQATKQRDAQQRDGQSRDGERRDGQLDGQDRGGDGLEAGDRDPSRTDREGERPEDRPDRDQGEAATEPDGRDSVEWPQQDPDERDPNQRGDQARDERNQQDRQQPGSVREDEQDPQRDPQRDPAQRDARDDRQDVDRETQGQNRRDQNRQEPGQRDPNQQDQSRDDRQQPDRQQDAQRDPSQRDQARDGQGRDGQRDPAQRDQNQRDGAQQDPRRQDPRQQDPRQQGRQGQQDPRQQQGQQGRQQDPRQQGQQGQRDARQQDPRQQQGQQGERDPRMQAQQDPRQQAQGRQQPGQDPRQQGQQRGEAAAAAQGGPPGGPPNGPQNQGRGGAAPAQDRRQQQQRQPQKQSLRNQTAKKLSETARKAPQAAEAVLAAADPQGGGGRRRQGRQQGSGSDPLKKLKQLKDGGQKSPRGAGRPPSGPPKATPHGRGVHNAGQHNQKLKDQHTPQKEQGEGREMEPS